MAATIALTPPLDHAWIAAHIPHGGTMCVLDTVDAWDAERIRCTATSHRDPHNPLRSHGRLASVCGIEYAAQAMAVHGGLLAQRAGQIAAPGFLVSLRAVRLHVARIDDLAGPLDVHAQKLLDGGGSWQYAFRVEHAGMLLAEGRAAVMVQQQG